MKIEKELLDDEFENYVLAMQGKTSASVDLEVGALPPLSIPPAATKEQWNARIFHNALTADPFHEGCAYFINCRGDLMHVNPTLALNKVFSLPHLASLHTDEQFDNVSMVAVASEMLLLSDGTGDLFVVGTNQPGAPWALLFSGSPLGKPIALQVVDARLENEHFIHGIVAQLLPSAERNNVYNVSAFTINLHGCSVTSTLLYQGTKAPGYTSFVSANDFLLLVEGPHETKVDLQQPPVATTPTNHKRPHSQSTDGAEDDAEGPEVLKCPRAGIGFEGVHSSPHVSASELGKTDAASPLYSRFVASSTPFSSMETPLHSSKPPSAPVLDESARIEIPTQESILGGFEECDDLDPNATAVLYRYSFRDHAFIARRVINCRQFHFLGASAYPLQSNAHPTKRLLFQYDVHGVVFRVQVSAAPSIELVHENTFQALAYVQASKEQKKFLHFHPSGSLAVIAEFEKRVFFYSGPQQEGARAHQRLHYLEELESSKKTIYGMQFISQSAVLLLTPTSIVAIRIS